MRLRSAAWFAVLLGLAASLSGDAQAATTVAFVWTSTTGAGTPGTSSIDAAPGDQLVGEVRITADAGGLVGYSVSLEFDTDLGNELDLVSATEPLPSGMNAHASSGVGSTQESSAGQMGNVLSFDSLVLGSAGPTSGTLVAGVVTFDVTANVASDGADVFTGTFHVQRDGVGNNAYALVTPVFLNAAVNQLGGAPPVSGLLTPMLVVVSLVMSLGGLWTLRRRHGS